MKHKGQPGHALTLSEGGEMVLETHEGYRQFERFRSSLQEIPYPYLRSRDPKETELT